MISSSAFGARRSAARVKPVVRYALPALLLSAATLAPAAERVDAPPVAAAIKRSAEMLRKGMQEATVGLQGKRLPAAAPHEAKLALDIDYTGYAEEHEPRFLRHWLALHQEFPA